MASSCILGENKPGNLIRIVSWHKIFGFICLCFKGPITFNYAIGYDQWANVLFKYHKTLQLRVGHIERDIMLLY